MDVILREDVEKLGLKGEVVSVARGYARNFLLPRQLAELATPGKVAELKRRDEQRARSEARTTEQAEEIADVLRKTVLRFEVQAGPTGTLFGSVTATNIAEELWRTRKVRVDRKKIGIDTIKRIGRYEVEIEVFQGVSVAVKTLVVPEGGELPPEEELARWRPPRPPPTHPPRSRPPRSSISTRWTSSRRRRRRPPSSAWTTRSTTRSTRPSWRTSRPLPSLRPPK